MITIKLYGPFAKLAPMSNSDGFWECDCDGETIADTLEEIDFGGAKYILLVNNVREDRDYVLQPGDTLGVMPLLAGG